ncbi:putative ferric-chelate reductase (NADH) [Helianthus annuus]|nr:putative ferric-chelate reductase (NADH) [Helianthus annuus]
MKAYLPWDIMVGFLFMKLLEATQIVKKVYGDEDCLISGFHFVLKQRVLVGWQSKLSSVALRFGLIGNLCLAFLFFPVTRGSSILSFGLTSEASIKYHIWLGHIVMTLFTSHGVCYIIYWIVTKQTSERIKKHGFIDVANRKRRRELLRLNLVKQEEGGGLREPILNIYKDVTFDPVVSSGSQFWVLSLMNPLKKMILQNEMVAGDPDAKGHNDVTKRNDVQPQERKVMDKKIKEMKDQLIRAKAYLSFALPAGNTHLIKELRLRVKELEQAMGDVGKDSDLSKRAFRGCEPWKISLQKAGRNLSRLL